MPVDAHVARVITSYSDQVAAVRRQVISFVSRQWGGLSSYRDADIERFVRAVVPVVTGGQLRTAQLTDAYLANVEAAALGGTPKPVGVKPATVTDQAMRGVTADEVYTRPGKVVWTALGKGVPIDVAARYGLTRAVSLVSSDMQLAKTHTSKNLFERNDKVVGYRRVLSGGDSCALCMIASTQRYHAGELMPIHPGCSCDVEPIYGHKDPGRVIDPDRPEGDIQVVVHEHGEMGPLLAVQGQAFTGPGDI